MALSKITFTDCDKAIIKDILAYFIQFLFYNNIIRYKKVIITIYVQCRHSKDKDNLFYKNVFLQIIGMFCY